MPKQLNVALNFTANTTQAKQSVTELSNLLTKIAYGTNINVSATGINQASAAAKELAFHLNKAYDATTGNFDLSKLNTSLKQAGTNITQLSTKLLTAGETGQQAFVKLAQSISQANAPIMKTNGLLTQMRTTMQNTLRWQISSSILHGFMGAIQKAGSYAKDLNKSLNNIRIVTGNSTEQMARFAEEANKAAKALNTTTTTYTDAALIYYQQGLSDQEVKARTDVTVKMANVAGESADTIASEMTAVWNNFNKAGDQAEEHFADVMTKLGAETASSTREIANGLEKFAAIADTVGLSFDYAAAALATVTATTRESADVVGTAFKTIFGRLEGLKLGETLDDGTDLNKYSQALLSVGVNIKDTSGELKDMDTILDELGERWETLSKDQQVALAETVGGMRQYNQMVALMGNWDFFKENLGRAQNSDGTLQAQADIYAESWEAARKKVKASMESLYSDLIDDKFFINLNNGFAEAISGIDKFIDHLGGIKPLILSIGSLILSTVSSKITPALQQAIQNLTIMAGGARRVYDKMSKEMSSNITAQLATGNYNIADEQSLRNSNQLAEAKNRLTLASKNLTEAEKAQAEMELSGLQTAQARLQADANELLSLENKRTEMISIVSNTELLGGAETNYNLRVKELTQTLNESAIAFQEASTAQEMQNSHYLENREALESYRSTMAVVQETVNQTALSYMEFYEKMTLGNTSFIQGKEAFQPFIEQLSHLPADVGQAQDVIFGLADSLRPLIDTSDQAKAALDNLLNSKTDTNAMQTQAQALIAELVKLKVLPPQIKAGLASMLPKNTFTNFISNTDMAKKKLVELKKEQDVVKKGFQNFIPAHTVTGLEALTSVAAALGNIVMGFNAVRSAWETVSDPDTSGWEKVSACFMALSLSIPMTTNIIKTFGLLSNTTAVKAAADWFLVKIAHQEVAKASLESAVAETVATTTSAGATKAQIAEAAALTAKEGVLKLLTAAGITNTAIEKGAIHTTIESMLANKMAAGATLEEAVQHSINSGMITKEIGAKILSTAATKAQTAANYELYASLGIIGVILAALTAAIVLVTKAIKNAKENSPEAQIKKLEAATNGFATSAQNAAQALESLYNDYNDYSDVLEGLDKCKERTTEWYDEMVKAANMKRSLEQNYATEIKQYENANPGKSAWIYDENNNPILSDDFFDFVAVNTATTTTAANISATVADAEGKKLRLDQARENFDWGITNYKMSNEAISLMKNNSGYYAWSNLAEPLFNQYFADPSISGSYINGLDYATKNISASDLGAALIVNSGYSIDNYRKYYNEATADEKLAYEEETGLTFDENGTLIATTTRLNEFLGQLGQAIDTFKDTDYGNYPKELYDAQSIYNSASAKISTDIVNNLLRELVGQNNIENASDVYANLGQNDRDSLEKLYNDEVDAVKSQYGSYEDLWNEAKKYQADWAELSPKNKDLRNGSVTDSNDNPITEDQLIAEIATHNLLTGDGAANWVNNILLPAATAIAETAAKQVEKVDVESLLNRGELAKALKGLDKNGTITDTNFQELTKLNSELGQFFTITKDGTWQLVTNADAFRQAVDNIDIEKIKNNIDYIKETQEIKNGIDEKMSANAHVGDAFQDEYLKSTYLDSWQQNGMSSNAFEKSGQLDFIDAVLGEGTWVSANGDLEKLNELLQQAITNYSSLGRSQDELLNALGTFADSSSELDLLELQSNTDAYGQALIRLASAQDSCEEEVQAYQKALKNANGDTTKCVKEQNNLAKALKNAEWHKATVNIKACVDELTNLKSKKDIDEQFDKIKDAISDAFDIRVTRGWVENNIDLIKKWRNSSGEEAQALALQIKGSAYTATEEFKQSLADADALKVNVDGQGAVDTITYIQSLLDDPEILTVDAQTGTVDLSALLTALHNAKVPAQQVADLLKSIGNTNITFDGLIDGIGDIDLSTEEGIAAFLQQWNNIKGHISAIGGYVPEQADVDMTQITPGSGGGGGSSNKSKKKDVERYHEDTTRIDDLTKAYERASRAKDKLYGARRVAAIDAEIKATDALIKQQEAYIKNIEANSSPDLAKMQEEISKYLPGTIATIGEDGMITNWTDIMNAAADKYKADTAEDADEKWDDFEKAITQYEETLDLLQEQQAQLEEYILQRQELVLEQLNEKLQIKIQIDENDLKMIEIAAERMANNFAKYGEMIAKMSETYGTYDDKYSAYETYVTDLNAKLAENEINSAQYVEAMQGAYDNLLDAAKDLMAYDEKMLDYYGQALDDAAEKLDPYLNQLEHINSVFEHYSDILDLTSKKDADYYKKKDTLLKGVVTNTNNEYKAAKDYYDMIVAQKNEAEKLWSKVKNDPNAPNYDEIKKQWDAICAAEQEAHERMLENAQAWADSVQAVYDNLVESILAKWEEDVTDGLGFDTISDRFDNLATYQEEWLTKTNQIYEMNKLLRKVTADMDKTNNVAAKQRLANFSKELEAKREQKELSQFELKIEQAKYEQLLAQIALEEAQNAKSKVMLSQDSEGNFGYVYTADQNAIDEAEQAAEDANNNLYNIYLEGARDYGTKINKENQRYNQEKADIMERFAKDEEKQRAELLRAAEQHQAILQSYYGNYEIAMEGLGNKMFEAFTSDYDSIIRKSAEAGLDITTDINDLIKAGNDYKDAMEGISKSVVGDYQNIETETKNLTNDSNALYKEVKNNLIPTLQTGLTGALSKVSEYIDTQRTKVQELIDKYIKLGSEAKAALEVEANKTPEKQETPPPKTDTTQTETPKVEQKATKYFWVGIGSNRVFSDDIGNSWAYDTPMGRAIQSAMDRNVSKLNWIEQSIAASYVTLPTGFASGGYTGEWGPEGRLALLHQKELVLNADDTENILKSVDIIHKIANALDLNMLWNRASMAHLSASSVGDNNQVLEQTVTITAEFPNARDRNEIEAAFGDLLNRASQYANR